MTIEYSEYRPSDPSTRRPGLKARALFSTLYPVTDPQLKISFATPCDGL